MNIRRKAAAIAGSVALLASIFTVAAAPVAASVTDTPVSVPAGGSSSGTPFSITFTENSAACFALLGNSPALNYVIKDAATVPAGGASTVHFSGLPTVTSAPGSLGATVSLQTTNTSNDTLRVNFAASDLANIEIITVSVPAITADAGATAGAMQAVLTGPEAHCVLSGTVTATGILNGSNFPGTLGYVAGVGVFNIQVTSACPFEITAEGDAPSAAKLVFASNVESLTVTGDSADVIGPGPTFNQVVTTAPNLSTLIHPFGEAVSQAGVPNCSSATVSPGTVSNNVGQSSTVTQKGNNPTTVNPGEQNQPAGSTTLLENSVGVVQAGTMTFTLSQPATGSVLFSAPPAVVTTTAAPLPAPAPVATASAAVGTCPIGTFTYVVTTNTAAGESVASGVATAITSTAGSSVTITWNAVPGATLYTVYKTSGPGAQGEADGGLGDTALLTFTDTTCIGSGEVPPGAATDTIASPTGLTGVPASVGGSTCPISTVTYVVTSLTAAGESFPLSASFSAVDTTSTSQNALSWTAVAGATGYNIYITAGGVSTGKVGTSATNSFLDTTCVGVGVVFAGPNTATLPAPGGVTATANNAAGTIPAGTHCYAVTAVRVGATDPGTVCITTVAVGSITITWPAVTGATSYNVYGRPATLASPFTGLLANTALLTYTDTGATVPGASISDEEGGATLEVFDDPADDTVAQIAEDNETAGVAPTVGTVCNLSFDRKSCTVSVGAAGTIAPSSITLTGILLDVDATVPTGFAVTVTVTSSPAFIVVVTSNTIAYVARVVVGIAAQPTIFINYNDQPTGTISLAEQGPGFFNGGTSSNNVFGLCLITGEAFTRAPMAIVTVGDLKLNNAGVAVAPGTGLLGTLFTDPDGNSCVRWTVFTASTIASTVEIRGTDSAGAILPSGPNNGPRLSVPPGLAPGTTQGVVLIGSAANVACGNEVVGDPGCILGTGTAPGVTGGVGTVPAFSKLVSMATRAFKNSVIVAAVSAPFCAPGATNCLAGNITITETLNGQFKPGDVICIAVLPRATNFFIQDTFLKTATTNDLPIATTNAASGLLVSSTATVGMCDVASLGGGDFPGVTFAITQQAFGPTLGQITISNLQYTITPDAVLGPVQVDVGNVAFGGGVAFESVVSNATIGNPPALTKTSASSAIGKTQNGPSFSVGTKVVHLVASSNNIVTIRIKLDPALVGKSVQIQVAHKSSTGVWSAFVTISSRIVGSDGFAYYYASSHTSKWWSFRGNFAGTPQWQPSHSQTVQVRWLT